MKRLITAGFLICIAHAQISAQNTIGVVNYVPNLSWDGYNLVYPSGQGNLFLLNNCGEIVHMWTDSTYRPGASAYLGEDGYVYITRTRGLLSNPMIHSGGGGELVEKRDWNNNLIWHYTYNDTNVRMHHDIALMPNGNVLLIAWERVSEAEAIANGRDPSKIAEGELWPDHIVEVQPIGADSGAIVWEWHIMDHLIQDFDSTKLNFGSIVANPRKININYATQGPGGGNADWTHTNSIDYDPIRDHIVMSVPRFDEVWIIDHSTTTTQAAGSTGGNSGHGGDLLYRWGDLRAYGQGTVNDRILGFQHDAHFIDLGMTSSHPDFGKIGIFNNTAGVDFSEVIVIDPGYDTSTLNYTMTNSKWGPTNYWSYTAPTPQDLYSSGLSGMQRLPNGNTLICSGRPGRVIEIDPNGFEVWKYVIPFENGWPATQGDTLPNIGNSTLNSVFKVDRYDASHPALAGRTLTPIGYIELDPDTNYCDSVLSIEIPNPAGDLLIYPNPALDMIKIVSESTFLIEEVELIDLQGVRLYHKTDLHSYWHDIDLNYYASGIYFIRINNSVSRKIFIDQGR